MNMLVKEGKLVGAHAAITDGKKRVYSSLFGYRDHESKEKMTLDTTMIIQSISKSLLGHFFLKTASNWIIEFTMIK